VEHALTGLTGGGEEVFFDVRGQRIPRRLALTTVLLILALTFLDTTIVSVALGNIQYRLGAGVISLQWVANGYSLAFASLMLFAGSLSDRFGRKKLIVIGVVVFCGGSLVAGLAPNIQTLVAGRAVMGIGAAASEPGTLSVIRHLYPDRTQRARALGAWAAVSGLALALGPVIGGILVGLDDWRTVFWFNLAAGAALLIAAGVYVPESSDPRPGPIDILGSVLGTMTLASAISAGIFGEQYGYTAWWIVALFVLSGLSLVAFFITESRAQNPMLNLAYLRDRVVGSSLFVAFAVYFGIFSIFFFTALYLDLAVGYTGWQMAGIFTPMAVAIVLGSLVAGFWVARSGPRTPTLIGCVVSAAGILLTRTQIVESPSGPKLAFALAVAGAGFGIAVVPLTAAVLGHVRARDSGMAAGATNTARQLGAVIGVAALGGLVASHLTSDFGQSLTDQGVVGSKREYILNILLTGGKDATSVDIAHPPELIKSLVEQAVAAFRSGLHVALYVSAALILVGALATLLIPKTAMEPESELD
jgi:EmrB/QacA subfamily drug resistance transporter